MGEGGGGLLVSCVPMHEHINNEKGKGAFIELGSAALSSLRVGKMLFL